MMGQMEIVKHAQQDVLPGETIITLTFSYQKSTNKGRMMSCCEGWLTLTCLSRQKSAGREEVLRRLLPS